MELCENLNWRDKLQTELGEYSYFKTSRFFTAKPCNLKFLFVVSSVVESLVSPSPPVPFEVSKIRNLKNIHHVMYQKWGLGEVQCMVMEDMRYI